MFNAKCSKVTTSVLTITAISLAAIANLVHLTPAKAQLFPEQKPTRQREYNPPRRENSTTPIPRNTVPRDTVIPMEFEEEKILVTPEETVPVNLLVAANIRDGQRNTLIPLR